MASTSTGPGPSVRTMWLLLASGLALQVVFCVIALASVPRTEISMTGPDEQGSWPLMIVGILGFGLGSVLSLTAVIAFGVLLGLRAHRGS